MAEVVKLEGLEGVRKALKRLPKEVRNKVLDKALFAGAKIIRDEAKARAPTSGVGFTRTLHSKVWTKNPNNLKEAIAIRKEKKKFLKDSARRRIGVLSSKRNANVGAWYWRFVEFDHVTKSGTHIPARPFLVPAFEATKFVANKKIRDEILKGVAKQAEKVRSRRR